MEGQRFGRLVVVKNVEPDKYGASRYLCKCDCGGERVVGISKLKSGDTFSCGCAKTKHGGARRSGHEPLFVIWTGMKRRCYNANDASYKNYGERGITVCREWKNDYAAFRDWALNNGYRKGLEIDRRDNNEGYSPDNCRWVTVKENCRNKRNNRNITINGETKCVSSWAEDVGIRPSLISSWIYRKGEEYARLKILELLKSEGA